MKDEQDALGPSSGPAQTDTVAAVEGVLDALGLETALIDAQGRPSAVSAALASRFGVPRDLLRGRLLSEALPHSWSSIAPELERVLRDGGQVSFLVRDAEHGAQSTIANLSAPRLATPDCALVLSLSPAPATGASESDSEARFRAFMDHSPTLAWVTDVDGRLLYASAAFKRQISMPAGDPEGRSLFELYPEEIARVYHDHNREVVRTGKCLETFEPGVRANGERGDFLVWKFPVPSSEGVVVGGVAVDVTERNEEQAMLRTLHRAVQAATQGLVITDATQPDNPIVYTSPGFERLTGYTAKEAMGRNCRFLQGPETDREPMRRLAQAVRAGEPCHVQLLNYRKNGETFWNDVFITPIRDNDGRIVQFVGVQTDITEARRLEDRLRNAQKMEAIGRLAGGVAHDFNNLLTVINGCAELLLAGETGPAEVRELGLEIRSAGERASDLTRQLLAFGRRQVLEPKVFSLNAIVVELGRILRRLCGDQVTLTTKLDPSLRSVTADPGQISQVLLNLVVNARDAMPNGGTVTIETRNATVTSDTPAAAELPPGDYVSLSVVDTGAGLDERAKLHLFEPFFTTKPPDKGTGLGLATAHGIVKQSGGAITARSESGRGTTFEVFLPATEAPEPTSTPSPRVQREAPVRGRETILVVEDEASVRDLTARVLRAQGYTVHIAADGDAALAFLQGHAGTVDLVISDVVMPNLSGGELAARVTALRPGCKVLFVSGYTDDEVVRHGIQAETFTFLAKPFTPALLAGKVREVLGAG